MVVKTVRFDLSPTRPASSRPLSARRLVTLARPTSASSSLARNRPSILINGPKSILRPASTGQLAQSNTGDRTTTLGSLGAIGARLGTNYPVPPEHQRLLPSRPRSDIAARVNPTISLPSSSATSATAAALSTTPSFGSMATPNSGAASYTAPSSNRGIAAPCSGVARSSSSLAGTASSAASASDTAPTRANHTPRVSVITSSAASSSAAPSVDSTTLVPCATSVPPPQPQSALPALAPLANAAAAQSSAQGTPLVAPAPAAPAPVAATTPAGSAAPAAADVEPEAALVVTPAAAVVPAQATPPPKATAQAIPQTAPTALDQGASRVATSVSMPAAAPQQGTLVPAPAATTLLPAPTPCSPHVERKAEESRQDLLDLYPGFLGAQPAKYEGFYLAIAAACGAFALVAAFYVVEGVVQRLIHAATATLTTLIAWWMGPVPVVASICTDVAPAAVQAVATRERVKRVPLTWGIVWRAIWAIIRHRGKIFL